MMRIKCISDGDYYKASLKVGNEYDARISKDGKWYYLIDEMKDGEYAYPAPLFEPMTEQAN